MTKTKMTFSVDESVAKAARAKSDESGVPLSTAVERLLADWARTGQLPSAQPADKSKKK